MSPKKPASITANAVKKAGARVAAAIANSNVVPSPAEPATQESVAAPARPRGTKQKKTAVASIAHEAAPTTPAGAAGGIAFADLAEQYLKHLEATGKSRGTVFSYSLDLNVAARHFGKERDATSITTQEVEAYFDCPAVTMSKSGEPKSVITTTKLRRTLRLALVWAAGAGLIADAPVPAKPETPEATDHAAEGTPVGHAPATKTRKSKATASAAHSEPVAATGA